MQVMRSLLFVPANRESMVQKARDSEADVVVLDLEDGVPPAEKESTRAGLAASIAMLKAAGKSVHVRVNHVATGLAKDDLAAAVCADLDGLLTPKAEGGRDIRQLDILIRQQELSKGLKAGEIILIPSIESAMGVLRCEDIVQASTRIAGLALGPHDYAADLGVARTTAGTELEYARRVIVQVCAAYRLQAFDGPLGDFTDLNSLINESDYVRSIGFKGKYVIHPNQIGPVNQAFTPREAEIAEARRIVSAYDEAVADARGTVQVDGRMVDKPVAQRARDLIANAEAITAKSAAAAR